jgi:hypothetical protein
VVGTAHLTLSRRRVSDEFGKAIEVGWAGIEHHRPAAMLGISRCARREPGWAALG